MVRPKTTITERPPAPEASTRKVLGAPDGNAYARAVEPYAAAIAMIREAIGELFGPVASLESPQAVLLRGPEPHHDAEAIISALQRVNETLNADCQRCSS